VSKSYGDKRVLRGVSLLVRRGERVAIIGRTAWASPPPQDRHGRLEADAGA